MPPDPLRSCKCDELALRGHDVTPLSDWDSREIQSKVQRVKQVLSPVAQSLPSHESLVFAAQRYCATSKGGLRACPRDASLVNLSRWAPQQELCVVEETLCRTKRTE